jgi:dTDP-L-rhamnose 4-epimerase
MRVLLTGGAGFIGRHVLAELVAGGHEVRVLDVRAECPGAELVVGDVRDGSAVDAALAGADAVCHLAAKVGLGVTCRICRTTRDRMTWARPSCSPRWLAPA